MEKQLLVFDEDVQMPRYMVSPKDKKTAESEYKRRFSKDNRLNENTVYRRKHSRIAGILGEIVFNKIYPEAIPSVDLTYDFEWEGNKLDVKCKYRTVLPSMEYEASFFLYQSDEKFNADMYMFMSTIPTFDCVWLCGIISKKDILENPHTEIWKQGEIDENNGMHFIEDTICLKYKYLDRVKIDE